MPDICSSQFLHRSPLQSLDYGQSDQRHLTPIAHNWEKCNCHRKYCHRKFHLWPTCSSSGSPPSTAARYFSSCPSDSGSLRTPCPPGYSEQLAPGPPWPVSGFRLRARLGFSIPVCSPGQRGVTPAFGYGPPHPSAEGTSTPMTHALPSAHYKPLRHPTAPSLSLTGVWLVIPDRALGLPVLRALSLCTCCRQYPGAATGRRLRSSHPAVSAFPEIAVESACTSSFSRLARRSLALRPAHSRRHLYVTCYTEGFSHFVTSMTAPVASGWSVRRVGLAPTGKRRLLTAHVESRCGAVTLG